MAHHASALKQRGRASSTGPATGSNVSQLKTQIKKLRARHRQGRRRGRARSCSRETVGEIDKAAKKGVDPRQRRRPVQEPAHAQGQRPAPRRSSRPPAVPPHASTTAAGSAARAPPPVFSGGPLRRARRAPFADRASASGAPPPAASCDLEAAARRSRDASSSRGTRASRRARGRPHLPQRAVQRAPASSAAARPPRAAVSISARSFGGARVAERVAEPVEGLRQAAAEDARPPLPR